MMKEIKVNIKALEEKIQKLRDLKATCDSIEVEVKALEGSGQSINMVNAVDKEYLELKIAFQTLLDNSISFFVNLKNSIAEADRLASEKLN